MARPQPALITPTHPALIVDGFTHFVARSVPVLRTDGTPWPDRMVHVWISATAEGPAIHGTLGGVAQHIGQGIYTRAFLARDIERHLLQHAGGLVYLRTICPGVITAPQPYRVALAREVSYVRQ